MGGTSAICNDGGPSRSDNATSRDEVSRIQTKAEEWKVMTLSSHIWEAGR
jgi:hypothetical protein